MPRLAITLWGPLQVALNGTVVSGFVSRKAQALLVYLVVESGRPHSREELAGLLWPEYPESSARTNLRSVLANVRRIICDRDASPPFFHITREIVQFNPASDHYIDIALLDTLPQTHALLPPDIQRIERAVAQIRQPFLAGFSLPDSPPFEEWLLLKREFFGWQLQSALRMLASHYEAQGAVEPALHLARRWLSQDPWQEEAHQQVMRLLAKAGQRSQALAHFESCRELLAVELGLEPSQETIQLAEEIRQGELATQVAARTTRPSVPGLPRPLTMLIGRKTEMAALAALLADRNQRMVTIVGPGGMGKTHLALEVAIEYEQHLRDGAAFIALAPLQSVDALPAAMAEALAFTFYENAPPDQQILDYLRGKELLLVLDNCEHLPDSVEFIQQLLETAPQVKVLATSRIGLQVQGEQLFPLAGLPYLHTKTETSTVDRADVDAQAAVTLFVQRLQLLNPEAPQTLSAVDMEEIARICRLLDGMPLGIMLAAAWIEILTPREIAEELEQNFQFLQVDTPGLPQRHRSLEAVFAHSWRLLTRREQVIFMRLSVFRGGSSRAAALTVTGATLPALLALSKHFLLTYTRPRERTEKGRYASHEMVRQFAARQLGGIPSEETEARRRHCAYFAEFLAQRARDLQGSRQFEAIAEIETEGENIRVAWQWAVQQRQVGYLDQALEGMALFYEWRGRYAEGEAACRTAVEQIEDMGSGASLSLQANLLRWQARFNRYLGNRKQAAALVQKSLERLDSPTLSEVDTRHLRAASLLELGMQSAHHLDAIEKYQDALTLYRVLQERWGEAQCLLQLGVNLTFNTRTGQEGKKLLQKSLELYEVLGDRRNTIGVLTQIAFSATLHGDHGTGEPLLRRLLAMQQELKQVIHVSKDVNLIATGLIVCGNFSEALTIAKEYASHCQNVGNRPLLASAQVLLSMASMYLGNYELALEQAQRGQQLFEVIGDGNRMSFGLWQVGDTLLSLRQYAAARYALQESVALHEQTGFEGRRRDVLLSLGYAAYGLGEMSEVGRCLSEGLPASDEHRFWFTGIRAVPLAALLAIAQDKPEFAVELYALAMCAPHIANSPWYEEVAGRHVQAAARSLPPRRIAAAQARGRARDLWQTAEAAVEKLMRESA